MTLNHRNNSIVQDVSNIIHQVLHETENMSKELNNMKATNEMVSFNTTVDKK